MLEMKEKYSYICEFVRYWLVKSVFGITNWGWGLGKAYLRFNWKLCYVESRCPTYVYLYLYMYETIHLTLS